MSSKVLAGMQRAAENLEDNVFYASADDDFLVDLEQFTRAFDGELRDIETDRVLKSSMVCRKQPCPPTPSQKPLSPILCMYMRGVGEPVLRFGKWAVACKVCKYRRYPSYCHGGAYAMQVRLVKVLLAEASTAPILRLDDVWIMGILRVRANESNHLVCDMAPVATHYGPQGTRYSLALERSFRRLLGS